MTTIAYKNGVMAADHLANDHGTRMWVEKIFKIDVPPEDGFLASKGVKGPCLIGGCGDLCVVRLMIDCALGRSITWPNSTNDSGELLIASESGVYVVNSMPNMVLMQFDASDGIAIGSGRDAAMGAMLHGASAKESVWIASRVDVGTGMRDGCLPTALRLDNKGCATCANEDAPKACFRICHDENAYPYWASKEEK